MPSAGRSLTGMLILRVTSQLFIFAALILLTRLLGPSQYGVYSFIFACMWFASLFNVYGLNEVTVREITTTPERRSVIYRSSLALKLILGTVGYVITVAVILTFNLFPLPTWVSMAIALTLFTSFTLGSVRSIWDVPYQTDFRMVSVSVINLITKSLFFVLIVGWLVFNGPESASLTHRIISGSFAHGVAAAVLLLIIAEICGVGVQAVLNGRFRYPMLPLWDRRAIGDLIHEAWPLAISGALLLMVGRTNILMLKWFLPDHEVGLFAAPMQLIEALYIITTVIMATTLPLISKAYRDGMTVFKATLRVIFKLMLMISTAIAGVVCFHSSELISLIFGAEFADSSAVMSIYIWVVTFVFGISAIQAAIISAGRQRWLMVIFAVHLVFIFGLNLYFIPRYGISGAAAGFLTSFVLVFVLLLFIPKVGYIGRIWFLSAILPVSASLLLGWSSTLLNLGLWSSVIFVPIGLGGVLFFSGWFTRAEYELSKSLLRSKGGDAG